MQISRRLVQVAFIAGMLGAGAVQVFAADPAPAAAATKVDASDPARLIESAANAMLTGIDENREAFRKDRTGLYKLVSETILPNFDTEYAAEKVLGVNWTRATPEQRERFVKAFYYSLLYRYGDNMLDFTGNRFKVIPTKVAPDAKTATVRTEIRRDNSNIKVFFYMRKVDGAWKAYNMAFEGVNYIVSYRQQYAAAVEQKGLEAVIAELEASAEAAKAAQAGKSVAKGKSG